MTRASRSVLLCAVVCLLLPACTATPGTSARSPSPSRSTASSSASSSASPSASPSVSPLDARVAAALARLDPRARVAQLFVVGVPLGSLPDGDALAAQGVGGIFLSGRSSIAATDLAGVTGRWAAQAPGPRPWVALDQEGGEVQTLSGPGFPPLPPAVEQGDLPPDRLAALADGMGASLAAAGITLDLAPVADVVPAGTEAANAPIGAYGRQYGSTPAQVQAAASAVIGGLAAHGVTATIKHFPGLGTVTANTDFAGSVVDSQTTASVQDPQVAAFAALSRQPAHPFVMVSSAIYARIDPGTLAMFSPAVVTALLRGQLGFDGVAITDDVAVAAAVADVPPGERAVRFLAAGGTLVLTVRAGIFPEMVDAVLARAAADPAFAARVDTAVRTALRAKARAGLLPG